MTFGVSGQYTKDMAEAKGCKCNRVYFFFGINVTTGTTPLKRSAGTQLPGYTRGQLDNWITEKVTKPHIPPLLPISTSVFVAVKMSIL